MVRIAAYAALRRVGLPKLLVLGVIAALALYAVGGARAAELAHNTFTSNVTISATTEGTANTIVTASAVAFDGSTKACVEFYAPRLAIGTAGNAVTLVLQDGGSSIGYIGMQESPAAAVAGGPVHAVQCFTPSAATKTYSVAGFRSSANATVIAGAGGAGTAMPGYIRITTESSGGSGGATALADLDDVDLTGLADTDVLKWDASSSMWEPAADNEGAGGGGTVTLSTGDRDRLDLAWWGVWALVGLALLALIAPAMYRLLDVRHGMGGRFERG